MAALAQIVDNLVVNIIEVGDTPPPWAADWPYAANAGIGWSWDGVGFIKPPDPIITPVQLYSKSLMIAAMTDEEFVRFQQARTTQPARLVAVFDQASRLESTDVNFSLFSSLLVAAYGQTRADELLSAGRL